MADENTQTQDATQNVAQPQEASTQTQATPAANEPAAQQAAQKTAPKDAAQEDLGSNKNPSEKSDAAQQPSTPEVVDEKTEFSIPDGLKVDEKKMSSFKAVAKELGLTKEQAQKLVDMDSENIKAQEKAFADMKESWKAETIKQLGDNAEQKIGEAAAAFKRFGDDEFVKLMQDTGLENHPAVVRVFRAIGSKIAVDKTVSATSSGVKSSMTLSEALYGQK